MSIYICSKCKSIETPNDKDRCTKCWGKIAPAKLYNIHIQFPEHYFIGQTIINEDCLENDAHMRTVVAVSDLITTFHCENGDDETIKPIMDLLAKFYDFGAKYFAAGKVSGEDVAAKLTHQLGEIYLGNRAKSKFSYHFTGVWPHSVNFGELCYSSDPSFNLQITWKYKKCELCNAICKQDDDQPSVLP